jgi:hypothetical protein
MTQPFTQGNFRFHHARWFLTGAALILGIELLITRSNVFTRSGSLISLGVTIDICLGIPFLYWLLFVHLRGHTALMLIPIFIGSGIAARFVLPKAYHYYITFADYATICCDGGLIIYISFKIPRMVRMFHSLQLHRNDFLLNTRSSLAHVLANDRENTVIDILASEIALLRYAVAFRAAPEVCSGEYSFSTHKASQYTTIFFTLFIVGIVEMAGMHILVALFWSHTAAFMLTIISLYATVFLVADYNAILKRPIVVGTSRILLRTGTRWTAEFPLEAIQSVRLAPKRLDAAVKQNMLNIAPFGNPNVLIEFHIPQEIRGIYGVKRTTLCVGFSVDTPQDFVEIARHKIGSLN